LILGSLPILAIVLITRSVLNDGIIFAVFYALVSEILLVLGIQLDLIVLRKRSKIATFRRLASISVISNSTWFLVTLIALVLFLLNGREQSYASLVLLGVFFAIAFRALIFGSAFYNETIQGLGLACVQPILIFFPADFSLRLFSHPLNFEIPLGAGIVALIALETYLSTINKRRGKIGFSPLSLLRAFLYAWTVEDATALESFLERVGTEEVVRTTLLRLVSTRTDRSESEALLIDPGVHPGPFYPVGSSCLPEDIFSSLRSEKSLPLTVHSISDHDLNLCSKSEVMKYISSFSQARVVQSADKISGPVVVKKNKASATVLGFGSTIFVALSQAPYGMEDLPTIVRTQIEKLAQAEGFTSPFIVDAHNSEGPKPNEEECSDFVKATEEAINSLKQKTAENFQVGFCHSSELNLTSSDIGPAGIGLMTFKLDDGTEFNLVIADTNNAVVGFREKAFSFFEENTSSRILELCTSDTHITAAKAASAKGYLALGDVISPEDFGANLLSLYQNATKKMGCGKYETSEFESKVKTIGAEVLDSFSGLLDSTIATARNGAIALAVLAVALISVVAVEA
jgi:putative membrane protein